MSRDAKSRSTHRMQVAHALSLRQRRPRSLPVPPLRSSSEMELFEAAENQDWEKVMVRRAAHWRPVPAPSLVRREPSAWGSASGPCKPSSHARLGLAVPNQALASGAPQALSMLHAGAPPCRSRRHVPWPVRSPARLPSLPISRRLLRPQSPFPRVSEVRHVWRMRERRARWRVPPVLSEYSLPLTVTQDENAVDPRGLCAVLCSGTILDWGTS